MERRLGEVFMMKSVLLNTSYQYKVRLFPQLMKPQGVRNSCAGACQLNPLGLAEFESNI